MYLRNEGQSRSIRADSFPGLCKRASHFIEQLNRKEVNNGRSTWVKEK